MMVNMTTKNIEFDSIGMLIDRLKAYAAAIEGDGFIPDDAPDVLRLASGILKYMISEKHVIEISESGEYQVRSDDSEYDD